MKYRNEQAALIRQQTLLIRKLLRQQRKPYRRKSKTAPTDFFLFLLSTLLTVLAGLIGCVMKLLLKKLLATVKKRKNG